MPSPIVYLLAVSDLLLGFIPQNLDLASVPCAGGNRGDVSCVVPKCAWLNPFGMGYYRSVAEDYISDSCRKSTFLERSKGSAPKRADLL